LDGDNIYAELRLDEPWDSPHNRKVLETTRIAVYDSPGDEATQKQHTTHFRVFVGKGCAFEGSRGVSLEDFPNGRGKTILVIEAAEAVPWTKPDELSYAPNQPLPRLGGQFSSGAYAAFADGSLQMLYNGDDEQELRAMITRK
jgi:hypothetical protein